MILCKRYENCSTVNLTISGVVKEESDKCCLFISDGEKMTSCLDYTMHDIHYKVLEKILCGYCLMLCGH